MGVFGSNPKGTSGLGRHSLLLSSPRPLVLASSAAAIGAPGHPFAFAPIALTGPSLSSVIAPAAGRALNAPVARWKHELDAGRRKLEAAYRSDRRPRRLLAGQATLTDSILRGLWAEIDPPPGCALVAVGGYGRGELFPHSDVDVVVLLPQPLTDARSGGASGIERFIGLMWDTGLEIGHGVRTIDECEAEMEGDAVIRTSLLERHLLAGSRSLYARFRLRYLAGRREDRLVFDVQAALAREFGFGDTPSRRASEQLMQRYYRAAKSIRQLNVIVLQNLHARLFPAEVTVQPIDTDFQAVDQLLDVKDVEVFAKL